MDFRDVNEGIRQQGNPEQNERPQKTRKRTHNVRDQGELTEKIDQKIEQVEKRGLKQAQPITEQSGLKRRKMGPIKESDTIVPKIRSKVTQSTIAVPGVHRGTKLSISTHSTQTPFNPQFTNRLANVYKFENELVKVISTAKQGHDQKIPAIVHASILQGHGPLFYRALEKITLTPLIAATILTWMASSDFNVDPDVFENLLKKSQKTGTELLDHTLSMDKGNYSLIANIITSASKDQDGLLYRALKTLCRKKDFKGAEWVAELVVPELQKEGVKKASFIQSTMTQLKAVYDYSYWSVFQYDQERFTFAKPESLREHMTKDKIKLAKHLADKTSLKMVSRSRSHLSKPKESNDIEKNLLKLGLDMRLAAFPAEVQFIKASGLDQALKTFGHAIEFDKQEQPCILSGGTLVPLAAVLKNLEIRQYNIGPRDVPILVNTKTNTQWQYLEDGLVPHDMLVDFTPMKKVAPTNTHTISFLCTNHGNTSTAGGIKRLLSSHAWLEMQDKEGNVYSAGRFGSGAVMSPDLFEFQPYPRIKTTFQVTDEQFRQLKETISSTMKNGEDHFNLISQNCSSFSGKIASYLFPSVSPKTTLGEHNTLLTRIKIFCASKILAEEITAKKEALAASHIKLNDREKLFEILHAQAEQTGNDTILQLVKIIENTPGLYDVFDQVATEISELSKEKLVNRLYNLITDIYKVMEDQTLDHPYTLFLNLRDQPGAAVTYESTRR